MSSQENDGYQTIISLYVIS